MKNQFPQNVSSEEITRYQKQLLDLIARGKTDDVERLLSTPIGLTQGINFRFAEANNITPLIAAAYTGKIEMIFLLVRYRPDLTLKDDDGDTAITTAEFRGFKQVVSYLKDVKETVLQEIEQQRSTPLRLKY